MEDIKDIIEILELAKEEIENNNENITATLDLQDLKSLKKLYDLYNEEKDKNNDLEEENKEIIDYHYKNDSLLDLYNKEKEKNKSIAYKLEEREARLQEEINEVCKLKTDLYGNSISKDKIREIIGELEKQEDWYAENKSLDDLYGKIDILKELLEEGN